MRRESGARGWLVGKSAATCDGEEVPTRTILPAIMSVEDRAKRQRLEAVRSDLTEVHMNPLYLRSSQVVQRETERLGAPSYTELYRDGHAAERWNMLHPNDAQRLPYVQQCLKDAPGVLIAASDYVKAMPDELDR